MPKSTREFKEQPDYKVALNSAKGFTLIGSPDAKTNKGQARKVSPQGRNFVKADSLMPYIEDMEAKKAHKDKDDEKTSAYVGSVFNPENREGLPVGTRLEREKGYLYDQAYMAGIIDSSRPVLLVSPIEHYTYPTDTVHELFWLADNGYTFQPDGECLDITIALPPDPSKAPQERLIYDYREGTQDHTDQTKQTTLHARLEKIQQEILEKRAAMSSTSQQGMIVPDAGGPNIKYNTAKWKRINSLLKASRENTLEQVAAFGAIEKMKGAKKEPDEKGEHKKQQSVRAGDSLSPTQLLTSAAAGSYISHPSSSYTLSSNQQSSSDDSSSVSSATVQPVRGVAEQRGEAASDNPSPPTALASDQRTPPTIIPRKVSRITASYTSAG
jgi:hypothetical protein